MSRPRIGIDGRCLQDGSAYRGTGRYLRGLLLGFDACREECPVLEIVLDEGDHWEYAEPPGMDAEGRVCGYPTRRAALEVRRHRWFLRDRMLDRSLAALGLDLLHVPAQFYLHHWRRLRMPCVVTVLDLIPFFLGGVQNRRRRARRHRRLRRLRRICGHAAGVVAISQHTREDCVRLLGLPRERIRVIPLGVDDRFAAEAAFEGEDEAVARKHDLRAPYVLYVGAQDGHKNLPTLVEAVRRLRAGGTEIELVLVGKLHGRRRGPLPGERDAWVRYLDYVTDAELPPLYRRAAVFSSLSTYEGFCLPAVEAMACGTPVVTSDTTVFPETVGDAGLLVDPLDADAAARALASVLSDPALADDLRRRGLARARRYRWDAVARAHLEVYRRALGADGRVPGADEERRDGGEGGIFEPTDELGFSSRSPTMCPQSREAGDCKRG